MIKAASKILVAGVGNPLRQDDAFGVEMVNQMINNNTLPNQVTIQEVGIGGIHLVQELHAGYDVLILVDAVDWDLDPGAVSLRVVDEVKNVEDLPKEEKRDFLADMHYTNPVRAMMLAKSLKVLPPKVYILGCQAVRTDDFAIGMSEHVTAGIPVAINMLTTWIETHIRDQESVNLAKQVN